MSKQLDKSIQKFLATRKDRVMDFSKHSHARLGMGHSGGHLTSPAWLDFQLDFAKAKDAVFSSFDVSQILTVCEKLQLPAYEVESQTQNIEQFILRPDLGRLLSASSKNLLQQISSEYYQRDILIVVSGGLSPVAIQKQAPEFLNIFVEMAREHQWSLAPVIINARGRVALGDEINQLFKATITIMLIGERPGLTSPDSMGIYFTYDAKSGCTDEQRNCISNIHDRGLSHSEAAEKLIQLLSKSFTARMSGLGLKDDLIELTSESVRF